MLGLFLWIRLGIVNRPTRQSWLELVAMKDLHSRRIVGWALKRMMITELAQSALHMAVGRRQPAQDLVHHTARGSQYTSPTCQDQFRAHGLVANRSGTGNCYDHAFIERYNRTIQEEFIDNHLDSIPDHKLFAPQLATYLIFYNCERPHQALNMLSPLQYLAQKGSMSHMSLTSTTTLILLTSGV